MTNNKTVKLIFACFMLLSSFKLMAGGSAPECDFERGEKVFAKCSACHVLKNIDGHMDMAGPNLYKVVGRTIGSIDGYTFSRTLRKSESVWSEENLHKFLINPQKFLPRTKMAFSGLKVEEDRNAIICHLVNYSK